VLAEGRTLVKLGRVAEGMALLDEAMVVALSDELNPVWTGAIYCHLMDVCHELVDVARAGEWTRATARWCASLPAAVFFRGVCRTHRAQLFGVRGEWAEAERSAARASVDLAPLHVAGAAEAHYEVGEIRRLRGDVVGAEDSFGRAHQLGRDPQPGLALLRSSQGRVDAALASLRAALCERAGDRLGRARLCAALVEVAIAGGETETARASAAELRATAELFGTSGLTAMALQAQGRILLSDGLPAEALAVLRAACRHWQELDAPHEAARTRLLLADAYRGLGDDEAVARELDAATATFEQLGATLDLRRAVERRGQPGLPGGLTEREAEVLRLVAAGRTNRQIASELFISDKTVGRHLSNIFAKLGLSSRTAATAYAFEHQLVGSSRGSNPP
jgi:DNA-binding NarL/FixJ family response regulator